MTLIREVAKKVFSEMGSSLSYKVGTMIEIPRAALVADEVCKLAKDFINLRSLEWPHKVSKKYILLGFSANSKCDLLYKPSNDIDCKGSRVLLLRDQ